MNEWVKTSDRLPEHDTAVLIHSKSGIELVVCNRVDNCWDDYTGDDYYRDIEWASHWMPLPEHPKD